MKYKAIPKYIAEGLLELQSRIEKAKVPSSKLDETINIATWNIREFGKKRRSQAAILYIAEILNQFDLIGVVELRDNLADLGRALEALGPYWHAVYSDMIPDHGGNRERVAYLYDKRAVIFNGLAAEANAPRKKQGLEYLPQESFWRSPYLASFSAGHFDFVILTTHIRWGSSDAGREGELSRLADWVEGKRQDKFAADKDIIVMGDFNIPKIGDRFFKAITKHGLQMPKPLKEMELGSNLARNKRYDQILHYPTYAESFCNRGGVIDFYQDDYRKLFPAAEFPKLDKFKFTFEMSDHLPLWIQVNVDTAGQKLEQIIRG